MRKAAAQLAFQTPDSRPNATIAPPRDAAPRVTEREQQKLVDAAPHTDTAAYDAQFGAGAAAAAWEPAEPFQPAASTAPSKHVVTKAPSNYLAPAALPPVTPAALDDADPGDGDHKPAPPVTPDKLTDSTPPPASDSAAEDKTGFGLMPWLLIPAVGLIGWLLWKKFK